MGNFGEAISCFFIPGLKRFYLNLLALKGSYKMYTMEVIQGKNEGLDEHECTIVMIILSYNLSLAKIIHVRKPIS